MAVYTPLSTEEIEDFLAAYPAGALLYAKGIAEGVENTNYLLGTREGDGERKFILTVYEKRVEEKDLPFFVNLMVHLAEAGLPCPTPVQSNDGARIRRIQGKPAALITFLNGASPRIIRQQHAMQLGEAMARLHLATHEFAQSRPNALSLTGWQSLALRIAGRAGSIAPGLSKDIERELAFLAAHWPQGLPEGVIHADLFPDNVFFEGDRLSGIIDFYFACTDAFMYDVAIALNAWCFEPRGEFHLTRAQGFLRAYGAVRPFTPEEKEALPLLARGAALRFLLTRAHDWLFRSEGALVTPKDPLEYLRKLRFHQSAHGAEDYGL